MRRDDNGAAAVEFALVFPLLLILLVGIIDMGFAFNAKLAVTQAAREGVRAVALGGTSAEAQARVDDTLTATGQLLAVDVTSTECTQVGDEAVVAVDGSVGTILPVLGDIAVTARAVMRCGG